MLLLGYQLGPAFASSEAGRRCLGSARVVGVSVSAAGGAVRWALIVLLLLALAFSVGH